MDIFEIIFIGGFMIQVFIILTIAYFLDNTSGAEVIKIEDIDMKVVKKRKKIGSQEKSIVFGNYKYKIFLESIDNPEKTTILKCNYDINILPEYSGLAYSVGDIVTMQEITYRKNGKIFKKIKFASTSEQNKFQKYLDK